MCCANDEANTLLSHNTSTRNAFTYIFMCSIPVVHSVAGSAPGNVYDGLVAPQLGLRESYERSMLSKCFLTSLF